MRGLMKFVGLSALGCLGLVGMAQAVPVVYEFNSTAVGGFGAGPYGTVSLEQIGGDVEVTVQLRGDLNFVNTGGPHSVFAFNFTGTTGQIGSILFNGSSDAFSRSSLLA